MFPDPMAILTAGAVLLCVCAALVALLAWSSARRWRRLAAEYRHQLDGIRHDLRGLCAGAVGVDQRVARMEQTARRLKERQEQLELHDKGERLYSQAIRLVHKGAGADELVSVCGLSRNEADLIVMMHSVDKAS